MPFPYCHRRLSAAQNRAIALAHREGIPASRLAREYGVTPRTIFRAIARSAEPITTLRVGSWRATFALTEQGPVQIEPWRPRIQE